MAIATINPATGETVKTFTAGNRSEVEAAIARAYARFQDYRRYTTFAQRAEWANATADLLEKEADEVGAMMTLEMGKTLKSAKAEALKCAKGFRYYAENAEKLLADEPAEASKVGAKRAYVRCQPLGVVLAVMPWNFPLWQAVRFAAPALMAGNVGLLKHASNVPQSALLSFRRHRARRLSGRLFSDAADLARSAVEAILRDPRVVAATFTGSEPAGQSVAAICGDEIKPTVIELGGSDPFIVMPSPTSTRRSRPPSPPGRRTTANPVSPPSGSSCIPTSTTSSWTSSSSGWKRSRSATRPTRTHRRGSAGHRVRPRRDRQAGRRRRRRGCQGPPRR